MSWFRADRPRSDAAAALAGLVGGIILGFRYVAVVGDQHGTIPVDRDSFGLPTMPLGVLVAPIAWWVAGVALGSLAWLIVGERRLPDRPRLRLRSRQQALPAIAACLFCNVALVAVLRPSGWTSSFNADLTEFTWSASPMSLMLGLVIWAIAWLMVYGAGRFMMGDVPDAEPVGGTDPDPIWEARRQDAADSMRGRRWGEP